VLITGTDFLRQLRNIFQIWTRIFEPNKFLTQQYILQYLYPSLWK